jgi:polar amino acid transport system substrate-binding protein
MAVAFCYTSAPGGPSPPMRRPLPVLLALLMTGLAACRSVPAASPSQAAAAPSRIQQMVARGVLRAGLSGDQPPFNMKTRDGRIVGFEVDIVEALGHAMGLDVQLVQMPFEQLLPALERGEVDLVMSGITITAERNAHFAFVGPYFVSGKSLLTREPALAQVGSFAQLDVAGRTYVALAGSTSESLVRKELPKARIVTVAHYAEGVRAVREGHADALIADFAICQVAVWRNPKAGLLTLATPLTAEPLGIALPPDDPLLVNLVQNELTTLEYTGVLTQLKARWLADDAWIANLP